MPTAKPLVGANFFLYIHFLHIPLTPSCVNNRPFWPTGAPSPIFNRYLAHDKNFFKNKLTVKKDSKIANICCF